MKKGKQKAIKPETAKIALANRNIAIGRALCCRDDNYCEVVRPTYSLFHITVFFMVIALFYIIAIFVGMDRSSSTQTSYLPALLAICIFLSIIMYFLMFLSKDFACHLLQAYYQPIVFNRKQQKVYIYYNNSKEKFNDIVILNMADLTPSIEVSSRYERNNNRNGVDRYYFDARVCVKDSQGNRYPLFHHFYSTAFCYSMSETQKKLLSVVEDELAGYWNWCEAYMNYQDELLTESKITWHFFRGRWPADIRSQFTEDKNQQS